MHQDIKTTEEFKKSLKYLDLLLKWNKKINLISKPSESEALEIHIHDGLYGSQIVKENSTSKVFYDVGSGNGVPGVLLALLCPDKKIFAIDSDERKIAFLKVVKMELKLENFFPICSRAENIDFENESSFISRGFSSLWETLELLGKKPIKEYFFLKAAGWEKEVTEKCSTWNIFELGSYSLHIRGEKVRRLVLKAVKSV